MVLSGQGPACVGGLFDLVPEPFVFLTDLRVLDDLAMCGLATADVVGGRRLSPHGIALLDHGIEKTVELRYFIAEGPEVLADHPAAEDGLIRDFEKSSHVDLLAGGFQMP